MTDALVIPVEAVTSLHGQDSCYVAADDGLEKRSIKTRRATRDFLEVIGGLREGEHVVSRSLDVSAEIAVIDKTQNEQIPRLGYLASEVFAGTGLGE